MKGATIMAQLKQKKATKKSSNKTTAKTAEKTKSKKAKVETKDTKEKKSKKGKTRAMPEDATPDFYISRRKPEEGHKFEGKQWIYECFAAKDWNGKNAKQGAKPIHVTSRRSRMVQDMGAKHPNSVFAETWHDAIGLPSGKRLVSRVRVEQ